MYMCVCLSVSIYVCVPEYIYVCVRVPECICVCVPECMCVYYMIQFSQARREITCGCDGPSVDQIQVLIMSSKCS